MALSLKARGGASLTDDQCMEIRRALRVLADPANGCEIRCVFRKADGTTFAKSKTFPGGDINGMIRWCEESSDAIGTYFCLNPVPQGLEKSATDGVILHRRWLLVDIDAARPDPNQPSTDAEHAAAERMANAVAHELGVGHDWPEPVVVDSGNGWHLLYRIDLPNSTLAKALVRDTLRALATKFNDATATIDLTVHNASRISKLPGTLVRKGTSTPERPHRVARLISAPSEPQVLIAAKMQAAVTAFKPAPEPEPEPVEPPTTTPEPRPGTSRLRLRAGGAANVLSRAREYLKKVPPAVSGQHGHTATFVAALKVVRGFDLTDEEGFLVLSEWNRHCDPPWSEKELLHKVAEAQKGDGERGHRLRRKRDEPASPQPSANGKHPPDEEKPAATPERIIVLASEITPTRVQWLWQGRVPLGKMTTFAGMGGLGKSFVSCDIAARVTTGREWPDGAVSHGIGNVLYISGEDDPDDTLVPRLLESKADLNRVAFLKGEFLDKYYLADLDMLESACRQLGEVKLVVIDPPTNYLGDCDDHKNAELRGLLSPFKEWCKARLLSMIFITHVNKGGGAKVSAMMRVMGSVAWVNAVRSAHIFTRDPQDGERRLFVGMKNNNGAERKGLAYRIVSADANDLDGPARIEWLGEVDVTADEAMNNEQRNRPRKVEASVWLEEIFTNRVEISSKEIWKLKAETTISDNAVREAKEEMFIVASRVADADGIQMWVWKWPQSNRERWAAKKSKQAGDGQELVDEGVRF